MNLIQEESTAALIMEYIFSSTEQQLHRTTTAQNNSCAEQQPHRTTTAQNNNCLLLSLTVIHFTYIVAQK